jgi:hypothetical protein
MKLLNYIQPTAEEFAEFQASILRPSSVIAAALTRFTFLAAVQVSCDTVRLFSTAPPILIHGQIYNLLTS